MRKKLIDTCITAAMILSSMLTAFPVNAVSAADSQNITTVSETSDSEELLTFEELYALEEDQLKQYCLEHNLEYKSKEYAEERVASRPMTWVNVKLNDYLLKGESDLLESNDRNAFNKKNYYDYDFEKMTSDLNMPEKYYKFHAEKNDFAFGHYSRNDADGNPELIYQKYAAIFVEPDPSVANELSLVRLYQLIYVWTQQNPIVYGGTTMIIGPAPDSPIVIEELDTLGDVNSDGYINAVDASTVLTYYANISTNKDGGFTEAQKKAADLDNNGDINAVDASYILSYYAYTSTTKEEIMSVEEYMKKK